MTWVVGRLTGALQYYSSPSGSNAPAIKAGDRFLASNIIRAKRFDFIIYNSVDSFFGEHLVTHRLCGLEGDKVEIRAGVLYVNEKNVDKDLPVAYAYYVSAAYMMRLKKGEGLDEFEATLIANDSAQVFLPAKTLAKYSVRSQRAILSPENITIEIEAIFRRRWNIDHFGPVVVPENHYFVLGDNRYNSQDSRYKGFIPMKDVEGIVLGRK